MTPATAQDLSALFGNVKEQVNSYNQERSRLADSLREIVTNAQQLLEQLGEPVAGGRRRGRPAGAGTRRRGPGRPKGSGKKKGGKRGRRKGAKMSAEARAKIAAAQKKRWAKVRAEAK
jgi:hypothetical protein